MYLQDLRGAAVSADSDQILENLKNTGDGMEALPVSLVISDPRLPDNPLVYVNQAFTELTGYSAVSACGRNCRFLQGPDTETTPVRELADAIEAGHPAAVEIVNYTADGKTFLNHLVITPIRDNNEVIFFVGVQAGWAGEKTSRDPGIGRRLAEVQKRVQDNISLVLNILREEIAKPGTPDDMISLLASRIECLAQLYGGVFHHYTNDKRTRLGAYLGRVCSGTHLSDRSYNVRMSTDLVGCTTDVETAAIVGLILSELLANAFDGVNPYDDEAHVEIDLLRESGGVVLSVSASRTTSRWC